MEATCRRLKMKMPASRIIDQMSKDLVTATAILKETYGLFLWPATGDLETVIYQGQLERKFQKNGEKG